MIYNEKYKVWLNEDGLCFKEIRPKPYTRKNKNERILVTCGSKNNNGYISCKGHLLHRIMWETFNGEIPDGYEIDHIDANKDNNALSNLQLILHKDNIKKSYIQGRKPTDNHNRIWSDFGRGFYEHYGKTRDTAYKLYEYEKGFYHTHHKKFHWDFEQGHLKTKFLENIHILETEYGC